MTERKVLLLANDDRAVIQAARQVATSQDKPIVVREEGKTLQSLALMAAALGLSIPIHLRKHGVKTCSRCQTEFSHAGAYCSKECFQTSNPGK